MRRIQQIRQRWWVVLVVALLTVVAATLPSLNAHPKYVGKSLLVLTSPGRSPDQDAMVAVGYSTIFNEPATLERLGGPLPIPEGVTFEAHTIAASPILAIEATADDPNVAQDSAEHMAAAFRDDINSVPRKGAQEAIENAQKELNDLITQFPTAPDAPPNPMLLPLQERIDTLRSDMTNQLQDLQARAGVTKVAPSVVSSIAEGAVGGLLLGILAALGMAAMSTRLKNSADLLDKTGIEPLAEVPSRDAKKSRALREDRLRTLANVVSLQDLPKSPVVALTDSRGARGARDLSEALATLSAQRGYRTVLVYADNQASNSATLTGFNEALANSGLVDTVLRDGGHESLAIMPSGSVIADRYSRMTRERVAAVFDELRTVADTIFVVAPSIAETTPETQLVCAAADLTILVVARGSSRTGDVTAAVNDLSDAQADLLGAVLIDGSKGSGTR